MYRKGDFPLIRAMTISDDTGIVAGRTSGGKRYLLLDCEWATITLGCQNGGNVLTNHDASPVFIIDMGIVGRMRLNERTMTAPKIICGRSPKFLSTRFKWQEIGDHTGSWVLLGENPIVKIALNI